MYDDQSTPPHPPPPSLSLLQREEEAPGQRGQSHPVQFARQEVHRHRGAQDQPITARLHQEPLGLHPGCAWQLGRNQWGTRALRWWLSTGFGAELLVAAWRFVAHWIIESLNHPHNARQWQIWPFSLVSMQFNHWKGWGEGWPWTSRVASWSSHCRIIPPFFVSFKTPVICLCAIFTHSADQILWSWRWVEIIRLLPEPLMLHNCRGVGLEREGGGSWGFAEIKNPWSRGCRRQIKSRTLTMKQDDWCSFAPTSMFGQWEEGRRRLQVKGHPSLKVYSRTRPGGWKESSSSSSCSQDVLSRSWALQLANAKPENILI